MLSIFSVISFADTKNTKIDTSNEPTNIKNNKDDISKEQIISWIKEQGKEDRYFYGGLSYELTNVDNDSELEVIATIHGGVHLGDFFIFDKNENGKYILVTEQPWHVTSMNFSNHMADPVEVNNKKIFEIVERTGGSGLDIYEVHLCYVEQGKFVDAWKGILNTVSVFQLNYFLEIGNYRFNKSNNRLYAWSSKYDFELDGVTLKENRGTNTMIYKFDGTKFILDSETGYLKEPH